MRARGHVLDAIIIHRQHVPRHDVDNRDAQLEPGQPQAARGDVRREERLELVELRTHSSELVLRCVVVLVQGLVFRAGHALLELQREPEALYLRLPGRRCWGVTRTGLRLR